ncbi:hypothetical protein AX16_006873 [Volvariella volvacea WC 439]|nr:hypothetical protein AX16_006873 [Volvariella volvacea WC 439]
MSYAQVAATNAPPPSEQPQPDPSLLNTTPPSAPSTPDDKVKVSVVSSLEVPRSPPPEAECPEYEKPSQPPSPPPIPGTSKPKSSKYEKRLREIKAEGFYIWEVAKHYLLRPGVAGGLVGLFNVGCLACFGHAIYNRPALRRDFAFLGKAIGISVALLSLEGHVFSKQISKKDIKGKGRMESPSPPPTLPVGTFDESRRQMKHYFYHPLMLRGTLGFLNAAVLGALGYFTYANWGKPAWDRRVVSSVAVGLLTLWGGEGCLLAHRSTEGGANIYRYVVIFVHRSPTNPKNWSHYCCTNRSAALSLNMSRFFRSLGDSDSSDSESEDSILSSDEGAPQPKPAAASTAPKSMDRFLRTAGSSSSDSESESESESDSDDSLPPPRRGSGLPLAGEDGSDSDESSDRPSGIRILSAAQRRREEMEATGRAIENALKINDWVAIQTELEKLMRMLQRQSNVSEPVPPIYYKILLSLESAISASMPKEEAKKKLNAKAHTAVKQKVKKSLKEKEQEFKEYQKDPEAFERRYIALTAPEPTAQPPRPIPRGEEDEDGFVPVVRDEQRKVQYTADSVFKHLQAVHEARGKKNTDRAEQIRVLERLLEVSATPYQKIRVLLSLISSRFDYNSSVASYMPIDLWLSAQRELDQLISMVAKDSGYSIQEITDDYDDMVERNPQTEGGVVQIRGSIISFVDRLDDEFTKSLQNIDPHGTEYVERLKDEKVLYCTISRSQAYYEKTKQVDPLGRVIMRRLEHIYSKPNAVVQALEAAAEQSDANDGIPSIGLWNQGTPSALVHALCVHLYKSGNSLLRTRAMLSHIYHHALYNDFHTARDMLLMSHLQESIHTADVATQILYNRTIVQLGLSAFRSGLIKEAQAILQDIFTTQRVKELLAQGVHQQRFQTLTPEQEKAEKQRQLPFHMHINTELLEAAFLVSSMLVEIPLLASIDSEEAKRKAISKPFRRLLDFAEKQVFTGPPESTRDHIMQASKALQDGDWERCRDLIQSIKIWSLMPESQSVKEMLAKRIQEQGLRTYLFTYAPHYRSLSLSLLSRTFSLPLRTVTSIVSKMIWNEELSASLDQSGGIVVFHKVEVTRVQQLAVALADKVNAMVEQNEKTLDSKLNVQGGSWTSGGQGAQGEKRGEQTAERRGRNERTRGTRGARGGGRGARFHQGLGNSHRAVVV